MLTYNIKSQTQDDSTQLSINTQGISLQDSIQQENQNLLQQKQIIDEENIQLKPKIITQRLVAKPKIITERIVGEPRLITEQIIEPTRQRIVIQPTINQTIEQIQPQYNQEQDQIIIRDPITREIQYKNETRRQSIDIQVQPEVKRIRTQVQFQPSQTIQRTLEPMIREPVVQNNITPIYQQIKGDVYITQPYIQPIQQRENVNIDWVQEQDKVIERDPITREPIYQSRNRTQNVSVPGNIYANQKIIQPQINREEIEINFVQEQPIYQQAQPIVKDTQYYQSQSVQRNIIPYNVRDEIPVGVPEPVVYDVPVYQYVYEPVEEPCEPCCCNNNQDQLGNIDSIINSVEVEITRGGQVIGPPMKIDEKEFRPSNNKQQKKIYFEDAVDNYNSKYGNETLRINKNQDKYSQNDMSRLQNGISNRYNPYYNKSQQYIFDEDNLNPYM